MLTLAHLIHYEGEQPRYQARPSALASWSAAASGARRRFGRVVSIQ
jgi:hypothetical protein